MKVIINNRSGERKYTNLPLREEGRNSAPRSRILSDDIEDYSETAFEHAEEPAIPVPMLGDAGYEDEAADGLEKEEQHHWWHSRWGAVAFVVAILSLGTIAYFGTHYEQSLSLDRIKVEGAHLVTDQEIMRLAAIDRSQKFYAIDLHAVEARILKHSLIKAVFPRRELNPSTIVLSVVERQPAAIIRSESGETLLIDKDGEVIQPKKIEGLKSEAELVNVPLLSGINEHDSASYRAMTKLVLKIDSYDSGAMQSSISELHKLPTGSYVLYTLATRTPILLGSPDEVPFRGAGEAAVKEPKEAPLFERQLQLLAKVWGASLRHEVEAHPPAFVDARFAGEIILKKASLASSSVKSDSTRGIAMAGTTNQPAIQSHFQTHSPNGVTKPTNEAHSNTAVKNISNSH